MIKITIFVGAIIPPAIHVNQGSKNTNIPGKVYVQVQISNTFVFFSG